MPKKIKLKNGSLLLYIPVPHANSTIIMANIKAGPRFDPVGKDGLSHFTEHMLFRGTKKYPSRQSLIKALEGNGSQIDAFSYNETNKYWIKCPKGREQNAIENLLERLYYSLIKEKDVKEEKGVVKEEMNILYSNPEKLIWEYWNQTIWEENNLGRVYLGTEESIDSFTKKDVVSFINRYYIPKNISFIVAGDVKIEEIAKNFNQLSGDRQSAPYQSYQSNKQQNHSSFNRIKVFKNKYSDTLNVALGFKTVSKKSEDRFALDLISNYLAGGMSSKLRELVMKPGLTYSIESITEYLSDMGYLVIKFSVNKSLIKKALKIIKSEIYSLSEKCLDKDELMFIKNFYTGQSVISMESPLDWAFYYADQLDSSTTGNLISLNEKLQIISNISANNLRNVSKKYFNENNCYITILGNMNSDAL